MSEGEKIIQITRPQTRSWGVAGEKGADPEENPHCGYLSIHEETNIPECFQPTTLFIAFLQKANWGLRDWCPWFTTEQQSKVLQAPGGEEQTLRGGLSQQCAADQEGGEAQEKLRLPQAHGPFWQIFLSGVICQQVPLNIRRSSWIASHTTTTKGKKETIRSREFSWGFRRQVPCIYKRAVPSTVLVNE